MRLFSYVLSSDSGFAPNPFHGVCTLACCKPVIRRTASIGDLIVGLAPVVLGHRLIYGMKIDEILSFARYWKDPRFRAKRPQWFSPRSVDRFGDNCYRPLPNKEFLQLPSAHSKESGAENFAKKEHDLGGQNVLVGSEYWYFGKDAVELPPELRFLVVGRGHRSRFAPAQITEVVSFLEGLPQGVHACPSKWPHVDSTGSAKGCPFPKECR